MLVLSCCPGRHACLLFNTNARKDGNAENDRDICERVCYHNKIVFPGAHGFLLPAVPRAGCSVGETEPLPRHYRSAVCGQERYICIAPPLTLDHVLVENSAHQALCDPQAWATSAT
jgi:hypothetical protein